MTSPEQNEQTLIMVVDDNVEFLGGLQLTLEMEGFSVWTATNGQQALDQLRTVFLEQTQNDVPFSRLPDLIVADIMMPIMDGYEFYDQLKANPHLHHIPFIFLTAKSSLDDIRQGKELGPDDYLTKPCPPEDVLATVRGKLKYVERQRFFASMSKRAEEHQQPPFPQPTSHQPVNNQTVIIVSIITIIITIFIVFSLIPS